MSAVIFRIPVDDGEAYWTVPSALADVYERNPQTQAIIRKAAEGIGEAFFNCLAGLLAALDRQGLHDLTVAISEQSEAAMARIAQELEP